MDFALIFDIVVVGILLISAVVSFLRGFVREVLTIVGLAGAVMASLTLGPALIPGLLEWMTEGLKKETVEDGLWGFVPYDIAASAIAYGGIFVITLVLLSILSHFIAKSVHAIGMGPVDRSLGVLFGLVRGFVLIGFLFLPFHVLMDEDEKDKWFGRANVYDYVEYSSAFMLSFMPKSWNRVEDKDSAEEKPDPLRDLTGENDAKKDTATDKDTQTIGTDEEAAESPQPSSQSDAHKNTGHEVIDLLIENQDRIKGMMEKTVPAEQPEKEE